MVNRGCWITPKGETFRVPKGYVCWVYRTAAYGTSPAPIGHRVPAGDTIWLNILRPDENKFQLVPQ